MLGAGAIGTALATRLTAAGYDVTLVVREGRVDRLRETGLTLCEGGATIHARPKIATLEMLGEQDRLVLAVKAQDLPPLALRLARVIGPDTIVVPMVNGIPWWYFQGLPGAHEGRVIEAVDPGGRLRDHVAAARIAGCMVFTTAVSTAPGEVRVALRQQVTVGALAPALDPGVTVLAAELNAADVAATVTGRIRDEVWTKAALNLAINPLSVVSGASLGAHFSDPHLLAIVERILDETLAVADAYGARATSTLEEALTRGRQPAARHHRTSMESDFNAGRPLEMSSIVDAVEELAAHAGLAMSISRAIASLARYRASAAAPGTSSG